MNKKSIGGIGEKIAVNYLKSKNFTILETNFCIHWGEIDIIAKKDSKVHFIEVKTRTSLQKGRPEEAINSRKVRRIWKAAIIFLRKNRLSNCPWQIDVLAILLDKKAQKAQIRYFPNISVDMLRK